MQPIVQVQAHAGSTLRLLTLTILVACLADRLILFLEPIISMVDWMTRGMKAACLSCQAQACKVSPGAGGAQLAELTDKLREARAVVEMMQRWRQGIEEQVEMEATAWKLRQEAEELRQERDERQNAR